MLRVHDWMYVRSLRDFCAALPDDPAVTGNLDGDTAVSHGTFPAALAAAGAVCHAVDRIMAGEVLNTTLSFYNLKFEATLDDSNGAR